MSIFNERVVEESGDWAVESRVLYKNNYYYSIDWFKKEFTYDIFKHYFEI